MIFAKNLKFWFGALLGLWALIIFATLGQQTATAQRTVSDLEPPFRFVKSSKPDRPLVSLLPPGETVIVTETFGADFSPVMDPIGTVPLWRNIRNTTDTANYYWNRVGSGAPATFANSAWAAATNGAGQPIILHPGVDPYPAGQDTWLLYGPIDLNKYRYATLSFEYYLDATTRDQLIWGVITDGADVVGYNSLGGNGDAHWITGTYQFDRALWGNAPVYIAFGFQSGASPSGKGAFIRNVQLNAEPFNYVYLPVAMNNYPATPTPTPTITPTPTATPLPSLYRYQFDNGTTDLDHWGGAFYNTGTTKYGQCIPGQCTVHYTIPHGNPNNSLRLYTNGLYRFVATSPNDIAPNSFDLYVDISPWIIYPRDASCVLYGCPDNDLGDWYGVIFNASSDTFGSNPSNFAYNKTYYRVYFYNIDSVKPITIKLERCDGSSSSGDNNCHGLGSHSLPSNFIGNAGGFDTVHIQRSASGAIQVSVGGTVLITANDATYTGASHGKYGVFMFSWDNNATQNPPVGYEMQVDFDNVVVYQR